MAAISYPQLRVKRSNTSEAIPCLASVVLTQELWKCAWFSWKNLGVSDPFSVDGMKGADID